jgi:carboxylesterase type B
MFPFTGLFHRAISQSGCATGTWAVAPKGRPKLFAQKVAALFSCPTNQSQQLISCLREKNSSFIYAASDYITVSCHKQPKNVMKRNSDKTSNGLLEHSRPVSTN